MASSFGCLTSQYVTITKGFILLLICFAFVNAEMASTRARPLQKVLQCKKQMEGGGFPVRRPPIDNIGGLIMLFDHMGPMVIPPGQDFPGHDHPHRGFETISYHVQGWLEHHCSSGASGVMGPGAAQWMTAGRGVVHGGNVPASKKAAGQTVEAFQIWVNLPAKNKMVAPRYQDIAAESLPVARVPHPNGTQPGADNDSTVKVLAGSFGGVTAKIDTYTPVSLMDVRLQPGATITLDVPADQVGMVYTYRGQASVGSNAAELKEGWAGFLLDGDGDSLQLSAPATAPVVQIPSPHKRPEEDSETAAAGLIVVFGQPIKEPVARYGPFVMNTQAEIQQAFDDYRSGKMGRESRVEKQAQPAKSEL